MLKLVELEQYDIIKYDDKNVSFERIVNLTLLLSKVNSNEYRAAMIELVIGNNIQR